MNLVGVKIKILIFLVRNLVKLIMKKQATYINKMCINY